MRKKAFTLIELLIYMGLLSVLIVVMTQIFVSVLDARLATESVESIERDGNYILNKFIYDVSRANGIISPSGTGGSGSTMIIVIGGVNYTYTLNGTNLILTNDSGSNQLNSYNTKISQNGATPLFRRIGPGDATDTIQFTFKVTSQVTERTGSESKVYQTTATSRQ